jgi:hypothetical protein
MAQHNNKDDDDTTAVGPTSITGVRHFGSKELTGKELFTFIQRVVPMFSLHPAEQQ